MTRTLGITLLLTLLAACGSSPRSNHYLLTTDVTQAPSGNSPSLGIGPIAVPEYLNRNSLVYSREGNQLQVSSTDRWAEPLQSGIKRSIAVNLASQLDTQDIRYFPWDTDKAPDYGVSVNLLQLDANHQRALIAAEWKVFHPASGKAVARRISTLEQPLPSGALEVQQIAPAYSQLLTKLSRLISDAIEADLASSAKN
jgi:uncharacterized lipoprotein YmbA